MNRRGARFRNLATAADGCGLSRDLSLGNRSIHLGEPPVAELRANLQ